MANTSNKYQVRGLARSLEQQVLTCVGSTASNHDQQSQSNHSFQTQAMMTCANTVNGRAKGRARSKEQQVSRPGGAASNNVDQSKSASYVSPVDEHSRQSQGQTRRTATQQNDSSDISKKINQVVVGLDSGSGNKEQITYDETLSTRPANLNSKKGTSGTYINLEANFFQLTTNTHWRLYQYRVDFVPDEDRTQVRKKLLAQVYKDKLSGYIFDGSVLFTSTLIQPNLLKIQNDSGASQKYQITLRLVGDVEHGDYHILQVFNIIIRRCFELLKLQIVGRNYYDALAAVKLPECGIELWPGYITSIRQHESKILMCCEISHKFMRKENVLQILNQCLCQDTVNYKRYFENLIVGCVVLTDYNNRTYRIDDIDWDKTVESTFSKRDGTSISYKDYYMQRYQINISLSRQPMLVSRAKARELRAGMSELKYLVPELCRMTGLTDKERSNTQMMRNLADHTRLAPDERIRRLKIYQTKMHNEVEIANELKKWDLKLDPKLVELTGRILPSETIVLGKMGRVKYSAGRDSDWTRKFRSNSMFLLGTVQMWVVIYPMHLKRDVFPFVQNLRNVASSMSLNLQQPAAKEIADDRPATYISGLEYAIGKFNPNFILCVASNNKSDRYNAIKKMCCVVRAVPSQIILRKNIVSRAVLSVATKVAIQINCKLGGAPWTVEIPVSSLMVIGFDVCHDAMDKSKSYSAMIASLDNQVTRYYSIVSAHRNGEELSNDFSLNIMKSVKRYQEVNDGRLPDRIIIYRDGVGDGQLTYVFKHEVESTRNFLENYHKAKPIKFAFIVVTKRINTRIFAKSENPPPGTVVDDVITLPQRYDIFIVSQSVRQVSPTSYNVIYDTLGLLPDHIQRITYKFTHTYYNWTGTIRVPAPCQYAHKLAYLVGQSLHRDPHPQLNNTLFFL